MPVSLLLFWCQGGWVEAEMGCAGPYPELQEGFTDTGVLREDFQDTKHPTLCCSFIHICLHQEKFVQPILSKAFIGLFWGTRSFKDGQSFPPGLLL